MSVALRSLQESDSARLLHWRNQPHVAAFMYTNHAISQAEHDAWFAKAPTRDDAVYWIIETDGTGVGLALINAIDRENSRCSWAFYIGELGYQGRGIGKAVEMLVQDYVFGTLGLNKLCCEVILSNEKVWQMHERYGFVREGLLRQHVKRGGEWLDIVVLARLKSDWHVERRRPFQREANRTLRGVV